MNDHAMQQVQWVSTPCHQTSMVEIEGMINNQPIISWILDLTLMGMSSIDYDVTLMSYFDILGQRPHCIWTWWFVWYIGCNPITYVLCMISCVGAWTLKHIIDEMFCVERGALEHMGIWCLCWVRSSGAWVFIFVLSEKIWNTRYENICVEREALKHMKR